MWIAELPPFVPFFVGAVLVLLTSGWLRAAIMLAIPVYGGLNLWFGMPEGTTMVFGFLGYELIPLRVDSLSFLFGVLFHIAAFIGLLFALQVKSRGELFSGVIYAGSALGAVFAGDLLTLFVFWELLAISSVFLIWARGTERSLKAGFRYLIYQVLSGVLLLAGALIWVHQTGSLEFDLIGLNGIAGWLIFLAFGIKVGFPLLHNWIIDAYPEATPAGTVLLASFTTKVAVYALARGYPGTDILIYIGVVMALFPIFYAVIENDLRRVLSYSMINQLGFMVCGIGIGTSLALNGAVAHAFADVIFKGVLMMSMGAVLYMTGRSKGTDLGGLIKSMPQTAWLCIIGAASISAFPLFSAFVTKSMIMAALLEEGHTVLWVLMLAAAAGVLEHAGIKIPYFAFFAHDSKLRPGEPPLNMRLAMLIGAVLCVAIGSFPHLLYSILPWEVGYNPYDATHVLTQMQLLLFAVLGVVLLHLSGMYPAEVKAVNVDSDVTYRKWFPALVRGLGRVFVPLWNGTIGALTRRGQRIAYGLFKTHGPEGTLARTWPVGSMVLWVAILLAVFLFFGLR